MIVNSMTLASLSAKINENISSDSISNGSLPPATRKHLCKKIGFECSPLVQMSGRWIWVLRKYEKNGSNALPFCYWLKVIFFFLFRLYDINCAPNCWQFAKESRARLRTVVGRSSHKTVIKNVRVKNSWYSGAWRRIAASEMPFANTANYLAFAKRFRFVSRSTLTSQFSSASNAANNLSNCQFASIIQICIHFAGELLSRVPLERNLQFSTFLIRACNARATDCVEYYINRAIENRCAINFWVVVEQRVEPFNCTSTH